MKITANFEALLGMDGKAEEKNPGITKLLAQSG